MKKLQPKIFIDTEVSLETGYNISTGYSIGQVIHFNDTGKEYYHSTDGTWKEYGSPAKDTYSLDEKIIGTWVDGKPIYRKVFLLPSTNGIENVTITHNLNIDEYIRMDVASNYKLNDISAATPLINGGYSATRSTNINPSENDIFMYDAYIEPAFTYHLILEYTKL